MVERVKVFFLEAKQEFKHVNWPTFAETRRLTAIVIGMSIGVAIFLGALDAIFSYLLERFLLA